MGAVEEDVGSESISDMYVLNSLTLVWYTFNHTFSLWQGGN